MKFIGILFLLVCCHSYAADKEMLPDGQTGEFQPALSEYDESEAGEPTTMKSNALMAYQRMVKKVTCFYLLPGTVSILSYVKNAPATAMTAAGIHVKNYLRHIYPAMHYW